MTVFTVVIEADGYVTKAKTEETDKPVPAPEEKEVSDR